MGADLTLYVNKDEFMLERDFKNIFCNTLGSKWFDFVAAARTPLEDQLRAYDKASKLPSIWVGEVSWLKQAFLSDEDGQFVPDVVQVVRDLVDDGVTIIDDAFIAAVKEAYDKPAHEFYGVVDKSELVAFLEQWKGTDPVFCISW